MAIDMGRLKNKETIILLIIWEIDASRGIHDRFLKDPEYRESQLEHDRTEEVCIQMDKDVQKDFTYHMTQAEYFRYLSMNLEKPDQWEIVLTSTMRWPHYTVYTKNLENTTQTSAILGISTVAPIIEFFFQLVAMEWFLVELMTS